MWLEFARRNLQREDYLIADWHSNSHAASGIRMRTMRTLSGATTASLNDGASLRFRIAISDPHCRLVDLGEQTAFIDSKSFERCPDIFLSVFQNDKPRFLYLVRKLKSASAG